MQKKISFKIIATVILVGFCFILLGSILSRPFLQYLSNYLAKTERVNANILLIEGWLPHEYIELSYDEFQRNGYDYIITTGQKMPEYFIIPMNGYLVFYTDSWLTENYTSTEHSIEINAFSELENEHCAHFNLYMNNSLIADFYADKRKRKYSGKWKGSLSDIDSILVQFLNDGVGDFGDRNLYVKEVIIDNKITIPYQNNSEYDISVLDGIKRTKNDFNSYAELARNRLLSKGIDSSKVIATPSKIVRINRTLESALAFREWVEKSNSIVKGINIVSLGTHARRTQMTYNKVLNNSFDIGIISLPDHKTRYSRKYEVLTTLRETIGIIYYWFILIPYSL